jgi:hypothetical protein
MKLLGCASVRRRLAAYHDRELPLAEQVAVGHHLQECPPCAREADQLDTIGMALRDEAVLRAAETPDPSAMCDAILGRVQAEREVSLPVRVGHMFEDMHLVWAGLSATAATATCAALLFAIWFFSPPLRADSLAGVMAALAAPGSDRNPVALDQRMRTPRLTEDGLVPAMLANTATEEDLVFALAAVVTQEGRVTRSKVLVSNHPDRNALLLMNAISEARIQPASLRGSPVAVNLVWLLTHTTVRGKIHS